MKAFSTVKYLFTALGFGMLCGAYFLFTSTQSFLASAITTNGTVIELARSRSSDSITYKPIVEFNTQNGDLIEFTSSSGSNPPSYSTGETVEVLYQESSPEQAKINGYFSLWVGPTILSGLGLVFFIVGFSIIVIGSMKRKKIENLRKNGTPIQTKLQSVSLNSSLSVNGRNPYQISTQWQNPTTAELHTFNSDNIWFDPTDHISTEEITVLIEKDNPKSYHVDLSFLPKVAS